MDNCNIYFFARKARTDFCPFVFADSFSFPCFIPLSMCPAKIKFRKKNFYHMYSILFYEEIVLRFGFDKYVCGANKE